MYRMRVTKKDERTEEWKRGTPPVKCVLRLSWSGGSVCGHRYNCDNLADTVSAVRHSGYYIHHMFNLFTYHCIHAFRVPRAYSDFWFLTL